MVEYLKRSEGVRSSQTIKGVLVREMDHLPAADDDGESVKTLMSG
jgi:hypothetical protein